MPGKRVEARPKLPVTERNWRRSRVMENRVQGAGDRLQCFEIGVR
jgi:hypothetical protein